MRKVWTLILTNGATAVRVQLGTNAFERWLDRNCEPAQIADEAGVRESAHEYIDEKLTLLEERAQHRDGGELTGGWVLVATAQEEHFPGDSDEVIKQKREAVAHVGTYLKVVDRRGELAGLGVLLALLALVDELLTSREFLKLKGDGV